MAKIKNAKYGEYMISQAESGSIKVAQDYENDKAALREVAASINLEVNPDWNTRQLGKKIIEQITGEHLKESESAIVESGEYVIFKTETGSIQVFKDYANVKGALREIAEKVGFAYDEKWNTRQFGSKLIDHLNA